MISVQTPPASDVWGRAWIHAFSAPARKLGVEHALRELDEALFNTAER